jgi:hypothetical protein
VDALEAIISQLETRPHEWGDPERRTRKEGGLVYHGIRSPLVVQYVVFEPDEVVWVIKVTPLPDTPLAE